MSEIELITILKAIIALPIIFFLPGYVTFSAFKKNKKENSKLSFFEIIFFQILASILITGLIALTLAILGHFSLISLVVLLLLYNITVSMKFKVKFRLPSINKLKLDKQSLFLIPLIILSICLFFHPSQEITGRHDIGVYISTGINIAKTGSILIYDEILEKIPNDHKREFYNISDLSENTLTKMGTLEGFQFPDFSIVDKNKGLVMPLQPPLQQIWLGIFYSIFGRSRSSRFLIIWLPLILYQFLEGEVPNHNKKL